MKKNVQHDFILTQILQELREVKKQNLEIQKDLDLLTLSHKTALSQDYLDWPSRLMNPKIEFPEDEDMNSW